ncbi:hypothetical protein [Catellatospora methionotrophica]|uniref:hypothetical protein n=1 Tax=Catellatospora methionotrophica TaxID=121620 RepID=UPI0033C07C31
MALTELSKVEQRYRAVLELDPDSRTVRVWWVLALGAVVYLGANVGAEAAGNGLVWVRRIAFTVALAVAELRRLRARIRPAVTVPSWVNPLSAAVLGLFMTGADLPNAFPYFIAIERIVNAGLGTTPSMMIIAGYALVYYLPCLLLLIAGATRGERVRRRLGTLYERLGAAPQRARRGRLPYRGGRSTLHRRSGMTRTASPTTPSGAEHTHRDGRLKRVAAGLAEAGDQVDEFEPQAAVHPRSGKTSATADDEGEWIGARRVA